MRKEKIQTVTQRQNEVINFSIVVLGELPNNVKTVTDLYEKN